MDLKDDIQPPSIDIPKFCACGNRLPDGWDLNVCKDYEGD